MDCFALETSESHLFEQRRRLSDKDRRQLSFIFFLAWVVLTSILFSLVILMDYRRFESEFLEE
jgi:hypothetical protein